MAPPRKKIDRDLVRRCAEAGLTVPGIAAVVGCSDRTLQRRFAPELEAGKTRGVAHVMLKLHQKAMSGSVAAAIFILKNRAGWSDRTALTGPTGGAVQTEEVSRLTDDELQRELDAELKRCGLAAQIDAAGTTAAGGAGEAKT